MNKKILNEVERFKQLLKSKLGDVKPLIGEQLMNYAKKKSPFVNKTEGDNFRQWVNKFHTNIAKKLDLWTSGEFDNDYIINAYNYKMPDGETLGQKWEYIKSTGSENFKKIMSNPNIGYDKTSKTTSPEKTTNYQPSYLWNSGSSNDYSEYELNQIKIAKELDRAEKKYCPVLTKNSNIKNFDTSNLSDITLMTHNGNINEYAKEYIKQEIPNRIACEAALNKIRPGYDNRNMIIIDSLSHLIYIFDTNNKFIAKDVVITGAHRQSQRPEDIATALLTWDEKCKLAGFEWSYSNANYVDVTGKNRKYNPEIIYAGTNERGTRYTPAGVYTADWWTSSHEGYAGDTNNVLHLNDDEKGNLSQAIHGVVYAGEDGKSRLKALEIAKKLLSEPNNPSVSKEFLNLMGTKGAILYKSYGCINVPERFVPYLQKYIPGAFIFNLSEDENNYLVQNAVDYFEKSEGKSYCPSPSSLGAEQPAYFA